jgi:hypothetical protein
MKLNRSLQVCLISMAAIAITLFLAKSLSDAFSAHSEVVATWFQGVGTVVAVAGAYLMGEHQALLALRNAQTLDELIEERKRSAILAICEAGRRRAEEIEKIVHDDYAHDAMYARYDKSIIESVVGALSAIAVHELRSAEGAIAILDLRDRLNFLKLCLERFKDGPSAFEKERSMTESARLKVLQSNVRMFAGEIRKHYGVVEAAVRAQREGSHG